MDLTHRNQERIRFFTGGVVFFASFFLLLGSACFCTADEQTYANPEKLDSLESLENQKSFLLSDFSPESEPPSNPSRDVWLFNTRTLPRVRVKGEPLEKIVVHRLDNNTDQCQRRWERSELDDFFQTMDAEVPTIIFIHGNYNSLAESLERATTFENYVLREKNRLENRKYRLLVWAWPSDDQVGGWYLKDSKIKTVYSHSQGEYVAELLRRFPQHSRVCLVGYCFGGITVCETIERLLQKNAEQVLAENGSTEPQLPLRVRNLMFVPAIDPCSLIPCQNFGNVLPKSEKTIILHNPKDFVLLWYPLTYGIKGRQPVGRKGIPWCCLPMETRGKVEAINIFPFAGRVHKFPVYFSNRNINDKLTRVAYFDECEELIQQ